MLYLKNNIENVAELRLFNHCTSISKDIKSFSVYLTNLLKYATCIGDIKKNNPTEKIKVDIYFDNYPKEFVLWLEGMKSYQEESVSKEDWFTYEAYKSILILEARCKDIILSVKNII